MKMYTKEEFKMNRQFQQVTDMAIDMSRDRRVLLDFLYTVAAAPNSGEYTHSREDLHQKALKVLKELDL